MITSLLQSGLGNRLKCIASCMKIDSEVEVAWYKIVLPPYEKEEKNLTDYFIGFKEAQEYEIHPSPSDLATTTDYKNKKYYGTWRLFVADEDLPNDFSFIENKKLGYSFIPSAHNGKCIDYEYDRIPEHLKKEYGLIFKKIKSFVNPKIKEIVNNFSKKFDEDTVSVHIRSWIDDPQRYATYFDINKYIELMNQYPNSNFFVCSDSVEIIEHLKRIFGEEKIITFSHSDEKMDAFIELLLLSENNYLIGSPISTFSEVAWWFSECKSKVDIAWK